MQQNASEISSQSWIAYHLKTHYSIKTETFESELLHLCLDLLAITTAI